MNEGNQFSNDSEERKAYRAAYLIAGYIRHDLTEAERDELDEWVTASDENMQLFAEMTDEKNLENELKQRGLYDTDKALKRIKRKLNSEPIQKSSIKKISILAIGIAASFVLLLGTIWWINFEPKKESAIIAKTIEDLQPGSDKAFLILPDGKKVMLDSTSHQFINENNFGITSTEGKLIYTSKTDAVTTHTLNTPRGGQYRLQLPDGTAVWLNAASSITYPTSFTGSDRKVSITGEAYFEVTHNAAQPFIVVNDELEVKVLGTHFNVNTYGEEDAIKVTLIEGSVNVSNKMGSVNLKPGSQASIITNQKPAIHNQVDIETIIAWKDGLFEFKDASIENIMKQVTRWYNVDVRYQDKIDKHFNASISRDVPASQLFHLLELTNHVHFELKENTVIVKR